MNCKEYSLKLLSEAKTYAEVAGTHQISNTHVQEAALSLDRRNFAKQRSVRILNLFLF